MEMESPAARNKIEPLAWHDKNQRLQANNCIGVAEHSFNPEMTVYEKLDAYLIYLLIPDSFDQTAFSKKRNVIFLHCQRKLTSILSFSPNWPGQ